MKRKIHSSFLPQLISRNIKLVPLFIASFLAGLGTQMALHPSAKPSMPPQSFTIQAQDFSCKACFTPSQACLPMIINELDQAKSSIQLQAYSFTSKPIADALIRAKGRGINVIILVDKSQKRERYTQVNALKHAGIPIYIDYKPAIAHNKIIIIDQLTVVGGSYNFSNSAENRNAENVTIIKNKEFAALYNANFKKRLEVSNVFVSKT
ncbi:MAG: phospholipase D family protein [Pseudomonadota bacterium]